MIDWFKALLVWLLVIGLLISVVIGGIILAITHPLILLILFVIITACGMATKTYK